MSDETQRPLYLPLPKDHIRVLSAESTTSKHSRRYCLTSRSIYDEVPYTALSYRWEPRKALAPLIVNCINVPVMETVAAFLRTHLQQPSSGDIFIDSICINQKDLDERASQVKLMGKIYSNAMKVCVWLGDDFFSMKVREQILFNISSALFRVPDKLLRELAWRMFRHEYWRRAWVIQELILATKIELLWGKRVLSEDALMTIASQGGPLVEDFYVKYMTPALQRAQVQPASSLAELIITYQHTLATDMRDKVYALLGVAPESTPEFPVDYSEHKTIASVFCDTLKFCEVISQDTPASRMAFAQTLGVSLRVRRDQVSSERKASESIVHIRGWVDYVISDSGREADGRTRRLMNHVPLSAWNRQSRMSQTILAFPSNDKISDRSASSPAALAQFNARRPSDAQNNLTIRIVSRAYDEYELWVMRNMVTEPNAPHLPFQRLDERSNDQDEVQPAAGIFPCGSLNIAASDHREVQALSTAPLQPGDMICRFLGTPQALALRFDTGRYILLGTVDLVIGHTGKTQFRDTEDPLDVRRDVRNSILFEMNLAAVADVALHD